MKLDFVSNKIKITVDEKKLRKYQSSQLKFYGYQIEDNFYSKASLNPQKDILTLIDYFKTENIEVEFSSKIDEIITLIEKKNKEQKKIKELAKNIKDGEINKDFLLPLLKFLNTLPRKLKQHQIKAALHLYTLKNAANFSVPGSGKTSVVLSVYQKLRLEGECNILFVIGPPSCFQPWQNEFVETLGRKPETIILSGGNKQSRVSEYFKSLDSIAELYLCTYQTISNDFNEVISFFNHKGIEVFLIIDEAHYIKQIGGTWANSVLKIAVYSKYRCVLTGTPIPKSYKDIFNLFDFLFFNESPITENDKIQIDIWEKNNKSEPVKALFEEKIGPLFYRVRKKELGLKPAIFHEPIIVHMNSYEKKIHEFVKAKIHQINQEDFFRNENILSNLWRGRMIRLRQSVSYPKLLLTAIEGYNEKILDSSELAEIIRKYDSLETPGKLDALIEKVLKLNKEGNKVLIWSNFIATIKLIKNHFSKLGLRSEIIYGKTPIKKNINDVINDEKTREEIRDEFVNLNSGLDILIANPAACAESISLHKTCFHAFYYDLSYNCAQYLQSLDRIHRVGGSEINVANYYFLQYDSMIDQDIKRNIDLKAKKMYDIIEKDYEIYNLDMFEESDDDDIAAYKRIFGV